MIEAIPFGNTGHRSVRTIFGAAAFMRMKQEDADAVLEQAMLFGLNHIDTAASYGDSELRLAPFLARHRDRVFLASKTGDRTFDGALASISRSRERLGVDQIDLIQLHNLVDPAEWETAMGPGGALEAAREAQARGWVRFIGVTGHGTRVAEMHLNSLERYAFDSVLLPYNVTMMAQPEYAADFAALAAVCRARGVAIQTIKSIARRRWPEGEPRRRSWYEPLTDPEAITRAVHFVLSQPGFFLNTSSDATLLRATLEAADSFREAPAPAVMDADVRAQGMEPLFVRGVTDSI
jgi:aryl-alcohol dehydrogenase-like predicted oxidoreductase